MENVRNWLSGKKVYILAIGGAIYGLCQFAAAGDFSWTALGHLAQTEWVAALIAAFRAGVTKSWPTA